MAEKFEKKLKVPKTVAQCRKYPIPYLYTLSRTIPHLYTLSRLIPYLNTLSRLIPYLNTLSRLIPYLNTLSRTIPYLNTLNRTIPYLNTLNRTIPYLNTLSRIIPYLNTLKKPKFSPKTNSCRQPIRIEYHSAEKTQTLSVKVEDPFWLSAHAEPSRLAIAYLNTWRVLHPPPPPQLTLLLLTIEV